jgi:hypothetical protein
MKRRRGTILTAIAALLAGAFTASAATVFTKSAKTLDYRGTAVLQSTTLSMNRQGAEFPDVDVRAFADQVPPKRVGKKTGETSLRTKAADPSLTIPIVTGTSVEEPVGLGSTFPGINHYVQRTADGGNQFSVEPPDMGLAVGNGFVVQALNDILNIFDAAGNPVITAASLNQFFYGEHAIDRTTGEYGHSITDPTVYFDHDTQRWFLTVLTFDINPTTGAYLGTDHLDIAVSTTGDPTDPWNINQLDVSYDGYLCDAGSFGPCFGDFPHVGADANGFYISTNVFGFYNYGGYRGVNLYALSKAALVANSPLTGVFFNATGYDTGDFIFSVMPATSPKGHYDHGDGGTEWFMTALDAGAIYDNRIAVVAMTNTTALNSNPLNVNIGASILQTQTYGDPLQSEQKAGDVPLGNLVYGMPEGRLDSSDARMTTVIFANNKLFGSNTSRLQVGSDPTELAGASYFIVKPRITGGTNVDGSIWRQGYVAVPSNNLIYSSIGVVQSGKGIISFTLTGPDYYPSSAYAILDKVQGTPGAVRISGAGVGPQDGFSEYEDFYGPGLPRPRWGDYSASAYDENSVWWADECILQTCTNAQFLIDQTCGMTRTFYANWATHISQVTPP